MSEIAGGGALYQGSQEMTLRDYMAVINRRKWTVIVPTLLATVIALGMSLTQTERFRASADVLIKRPPSATNVGTLDPALTVREVQNELLRARGSAMQDAAQAQIGSEPELSVGLANSDDADVLVFTAESRSAERATDAANIYADTYIAERRAALTADYQARIRVVQERIIEIEAQLAEYPADSVDETFVDLVSQKSQYEQELEGLFTSVSLANESGAQVIDAAQIPDGPFEPTPVRTGALALVVGLLIGLGAAFLIDHLDNSVRDEEDLVKATRLPVLAVIPKLDGWKPADTHVVTRENPTAPPAEAYRALRTALQFLKIDKPLDIIQVTSPKPGDGKSTTSANIAVACAKAGQRVLLVDCDLRRPRLQHFFGLHNESGFTSVLMGAPIDQAIQKVDGEPNLLVMPSGPIPPDPSELLSGARAKALLARLKEHFDLVVIDSPPVLAVADPLIISGSVDGVILVTSANKTAREEAAHAVDQLAQVGAPVLGGVLNSFDAKRASSYEYRYAYGTYAK